MMKMIVAAQFDNIAFNIEIEKYTQIDENTHKHSTKYISVIGLGLMTVNS